VVVGVTEFGLAVNDIGTTIDWQVEESVVEKDSVTGDYKTRTLDGKNPLTSEVPTTILLTASTRFAGVLAAGEVARNVKDVTTWHVGAERWLGKTLALRAGLAYDANKMTQTSGGLGLRMGRIGLDFAVATNSRNITRERATELGAGFAFYF
jgi:hypothetical protein